MTEPETYSVLCACSWPDMSQVHYRKGLLHPNSALSSRQLNIRWKIASVPDYCGVISLQANSYVHNQGQVCTCEDAERKCSGCVRFCRFCQESIHAGNQRIAQQDWRALQHYMSCSSVKEVAVWMIGCCQPAESEGCAHQESTHEIWRGITADCICTTALPLVMLILSKAATYDKLTTKP